MARVTKNEISDKQLLVLFSKLNDSLGSFGKQQVDIFLHDLLGSEERIMLAKRFAAVVMLNEGHTLYNVAATLHVSTSTAKRIAKRLEHDEYAQLVSLLKTNKKAYLAILETIDSVLTLGGALPRYGQARL